MPISKASPGWSGSTSPSFLGSASVSPASRLRRKPAPAWPWCRRCPPTRTAGGAGAASVSPCSNRGTLRFRRRGGGGSTSAAGLRSPTSCAVAADASSSASMAPPMNIFRKRLISPSRPLPARPRLRPVSSPAAARWSRRRAAARRSKCRCPRSTAPARCSEPWPSAPSRSRAVAAAAQQGLGRARGSSSPKIAAFTSGVERPIS